MGLKSAFSFENTTINTQALGIKQILQIWETIFAKITAQKFDFRQILIEKFQLLRQKRREKTLLKRAYENVKKQLQIKILEVIELQKKFDAKKLFQIVKIIVNRD